MADENCTILVTGATGLVGRAVQKVAADEHRGRPKAAENTTCTWVFCSSKDADLRDGAQTQALFTRHKPTHVIHLAAMVGGLFDNMARKLDFLRQNLSINDNVLAASHAHGVKKVVSCLSTCIFPDKTTYPIDETMLHDGPPHPSNFGFSYARRMTDIFNQMYHQQHGSLFTSVIPCNVFGPHDNFDLTHSHVIPALIRKITEAHENGEPTVTVLGSGKSLRQFMYSPDLARLILWVLRHYDSVEPIILAVDEKDEIPISFAAEAIKATVGYTGDIIYDTSMADGQYKKTVSNAKLRSLYKDFTFTPFEQGIRETVAWFRLNRDTARL